MSLSVIGTVLWSPILLGERRGKPLYSWGMGLSLLLLEGKPRRMVSSGEDTILHARRKLRRVLPLLGEDIRIDSLNVVVESHTHEVIELLEKGRNIRMDMEGPIDWNNEKAKRARVSGPPGGRQKMSMILINNGPTILTPHGEPLSPEGEMYPHEVVAYLLKQSHPDRREVQPDEQ